MKDLSTILIEETIAEIKYIQKHQHDMKAAEKASRADTVLAYLRLIEKANLTTAFNRMAELIGEIDAEQVSAKMRSRSCPGCTSLTMSKARYNGLRDKLSEALIFTEEAKALTTSEFVSMASYFAAVAEGIVDVDLEKIKKIALVNNLRP